MKNIFTLIGGLLLAFILAGAPALADEASSVKWTDRITLSGKIELEAGFESTDPAEGDGEDTSDLSVATVDLGIDLKVVDHVSGHVVFEYVDDEDVVVDEAAVTLDGGDRLPLFLTAGKIYVPFGRFDTQMISDPLTEDVGESRETAVQVGFAAGGVYGSVFGFNGDVNEADGGDDQIDNFGASAGYTLASGAFSIDAGMSYINNLVDAGGWADIIDNEKLVLDSYVAGIGVYATGHVGPVTVIGEYIRALDDIEWADGKGGITNDDKIAAWNAEVGYSVTLSGRETIFVAGYQGTDNARNRFPESRYVGSVGVGIYTHTTLTLEYCHNEFENDDKDDTVTVQLAIVF